MASISLASIAAYAKTYPAKARDFSAQIFKLAESVKAYVDAGLSALLVDEDDMTSDSAVLAPTQQSVKAYVDAAIAAPEAASIRSATNAEIAAIDDATAGDVYFDSDNGNLVLFTAAAVYVTIDQTAS